MATVTALFRECHRLRLHLKRLQEEIDLGPRVLKIRQTQLAAEQQAHKDHHEHITKLKLKQRDDEGTLKQTETRLAKLQEQLNSASNSKEFDAKQSEIRQANELKSKLEDAILTTIMELEEATAAVPAVEKKWAEAQAEFKQNELDAAERLVRLKEEQKNAREELAKVESQLPDIKVKAYYTAQTKVHGPDALAAVKGNDCQGCRTGLTQQKMIELRAGAYTVCQSCGKMLYPAEAKPSEPEV
jgi:predicted  nucleic acid-binding Zn-ribbon protein